MTAAMSWQRSLALVVALAACAPAEDPAAAPAAWRAGDVFTERCRLVVESAIRPPGADAGDAALERETVEWTLARRCVGASPDGVPQRMLVLVTSWRRRAALGEDSSLSGALVEVDVDGGRVEAVEVARELSPAAKAWLADALLPPPEWNALVRALAPRPVDREDGDTWDADPDVVAAWLSRGARTPLPGARVRGRIAVQPAVAEGERAVVFQVHADLEGLAGPDGVWMRGSSCEISGRATGPMAEWGRVGSFEMETTTTGRRSGAGPTAAVYERTVLTRTGEAGGEVPEPRAR